jgi:hypothetical protein
MGGMFFGCRCRTQPHRDVEGHRAEYSFGQLTHVKPTAKPTFVAVHLTIRIKRQQGRVFYGIKQSKRASE